MIRTAPKSLVPALVALACLFCGAPQAHAQSTTTYGTGGSSNTFTGGTIAPGDTVLLNDGASVTGNVTDNGTLQFNQSAGNTLTISNLLSGTGTLSLTNTGTLNLTGTSGAANTVVLDMTTSASLGLLQIRSGTGTLRVGNSGSGTLNVIGGRVSNAIGTIGSLAGSVGTATVSSGTWANSGDLIVGKATTGTLNVSGGIVTNTNGTIGSGTLGAATVSSGTWANSGDLVVGNFGTGTLNVTGGIVTNANGTLGLRVVKNDVSNGMATVSGGTWANSGGLTVGSSGNGTLNVTGGLVTVGGTLSRGTYGTINLNSGGTLQIGVGGTTGVLDVSTLTNNGTLVFNRSDASTYSGIISGSGAVTKQGGGTLNFTGTSSYTGATAVDGGKLLVNGQLGNTAVSVNVGGLLGGSGTILGDVTVGSSGTLAPGNSPGVLTVGSLSLLAGSHALMEITGTSGSLYDQIVGVGSGGLTYGGSLDLVMSGSYADQTTFHLFSNFSSSTGDFAAVGLNATGEYAGLTFAGLSGVWTSTWTTNHQRLVFSTNTGNLVVVPEPSTYAMALAGLACGGWQMFQRRRRLRQATSLAA